MEQQEKHPAFTHADITYILPVPVISIYSLRLVQTINEHVTMKITAMAPDTLELRDIEAVPENAKVEINLPGPSTPYFAGVCTGISLQFESGLKMVTIEALSWTYVLDIVKYNRSYQHLGISYEALLEGILKEYPDAKYLVELPPGRQYDRFIVQYRETPWELLKRVAAREGTVLTSEYADADHRPRFWLGLPQSVSQELTVSSEKCIRKDNKKYLELVANSFPQVQEADFLVYQTTGYETLHLGQAVTYNGRQLVVVHIDSRLERELLTHTFTLAPAENVALKEPGENTNLKGCALPGKVLERSGVHVKIHLDIDESQDKATAIWFPYSADADSFMYCMPHEGETINLYFRNVWEAQALAISGARGNGQSCQKTGDYNHRYFTNHERKEMYIAPDTLSFTADESAAVKIAIVMTDANGIDIVSAKDIVFAADNDIKIKGKTITMEAGAAGSGATTPGLYINTGLASIVMKDDVNNFYGKPVKLEGTNKAPCPQPEEVPAEEAEADEENKMTAEDWAELGLAVAGFIPSPTISTAAAIGEAGLAVKQGDYLGAGISLLGGVPFVGGFVRVAKIVKKGKIARKIFKVLNAGKKVTKLKKLRRLPFGKMKTRVRRVQGNPKKAIDDAVEKIAKGSSNAKEKLKIESIPLAKPGEDLYVGSYSKSRYWNNKTGLNETHTPHHVVQDAVSGSSHGRGTTINIRKDIHENTATYKSLRDLPDLRQHLAADVKELRNLLKDAGYDRSTVNAQLWELIKQNKVSGGLTKK